MYWQDMAKVSVVHVGDVMRKAGQYTQHHM